MLNKINVIEIVKIALKAGEAIEEVYATDFQVETKADESPLTIADQRSHEAIVKGLTHYWPSIPILSEEGKHEAFSERQAWTYAWVVDPLDGTKEFVKRNGEFTVNIALIHDGKPVLGVIFAPILKKVYVAKVGLGSFMLETNQVEQLNSENDLQTMTTKLPIQAKRDYISVVASRSHLSKETEEYINGLEKRSEVKITSAGSSLKLCLVAEGKADVYPRFAPTMEWDTAAGQAIVEMAGGIIVEAKSKEPLTYNKENLLNPWFIVAQKEFLI